MHAFIKCRFCTYSCLDLDHGKVHLSSDNVTCVTGAKMGGREGIRKHRACVWKTGEGKDLGFIQGPMLKSRVP